MKRHFLLISRADSVATSLVGAAMRAGDDLATVQDTNEAIRLVRLKSPDAVLCALDPSDTEAVIICRRLRRYSRAPIVMLISNKSVDTVLRGYRLGADAHIPIPCDLREFSARFRALLRRSPVPA